MAKAVKHHAKRKHFAHPDLHARERAAQEVLAVAFIVVSLITLWGVITFL